MTEPEYTDAPRSTITLEGWLLKDHTIVLRLAQGFTGPGVDAYLLDDGVIWAVLYGETVNDALDAVAGWLGLVGWRS